MNEEAFIWPAALVVVKVVEVELGPVGIVLVWGSWVGDGLVPGVCRLPVEVDWGVVEVEAGEGGARGSEPEAVPVVADAPVPDPEPDPELDPVPLAAAPEVLTWTRVVPVAEAVSEPVTDPLTDPLAEPVAEPLAEVAVAVLDADLDEVDFGASQLKSKRDLEETVVPTIPN